MELATQYLHPKVKHVSFSAFVAPAHLNDVMLSGATSLAFIVLKD
jgi:hypothetical protein